MQKAKDNKSAPADEDDMDPTVIAPLLSFQWNS